MEIDSVEEWAYQDATLLLQELKRRTKHRQDSYAAATGKVSNWWEWTTKRKILQKKGQLDHVI